MNHYLISALWLAGFLLSYWMLHAEHEAEGSELTNGGQVLSVLLSMLSVAMVLFLLIKAWALSVKPYWSKPAKKPKNQNRK